MAGEGCPPCPQAEGALDVGALTQQIHESFVKAAPLLLDANAQQARRHQVTWRALHGR